MKLNRQKSLVTIELRPRIAAAVKQLEERRQMLWDLIQVPLSDVPAGTPDGTLHLHAAIDEVEGLIAELVTRSLVERADYI